MTSFFMMLDWLALTTPKTNEITTQMIADNFTNAIKMAGRDQIVERADAWHGADREV